MTASEIDFDHFDLDQNNHTENAVKCLSLYNVDSL